VTKDELTTALHNLESTVELKGGKWDREMYNYVLAQCAWLDESEFLGALTRCKAELRFAIVPADVLDRCPSLQVMSADEAWAAIDGKTEAATVVWTDLAAAAHAEVAQMTDPVAQRMAFKATYARMAEAWKTAGKRPRSQVSLGTDPTRRADAVRAAVKAGRLPNQEARRLLPEAAGIDAKALPPPREIPRELTLSEEDREFIAWMMRPDTKEPSVTEVRHRLGPYANEKLRLFLSAAQTAKSYATGCVGCGCEIDESTASYCPACSPAHAQRCAERQAAAEAQNKRESDALARMRGATR